MAISRAKKEQLVQRYGELIANSSALVFTDYRGTRVPQVQALRGKMGDHSAVYAVVKNTLLGIAMRQAGIDVETDLLSGTNGVVFLGEDIGKGVKALKDWLKESKITTMVIKGAVLENSALDVTGAEALADLPTKEQMLAKVLGTINAPASTLVRIISAPQSSLVRVINAHVESQKEAA
ncbi:MAG: 50S ribosomal protein L10 [Caldilineaceae bacterium]|nr:50S ribosomal protein L10 [Caldilineaceae bacterium]MBP8107557.1 50S ribosomal protein L10 [Caldilineaceae bacterium]MBP8122465.1 50S ribosomal protein L10 [Caldilineaceae bacterium]